MLIDFEQPRFSHGQVLQMLPELHGKRLRQWHDTGFLHGTGVPNAKSRYAPIAIPMFAFVMELNAYGIGPMQAFAIADDIADIAADVHRNYPHDYNADGAVEWSVESDRQYRTGYVHKNVVEGGFCMLIRKRPLGSAGNAIPQRVSIRVEVDLLAIDIINRIYALIADEDRK